MEVQQRTPKAAWIIWAIATSFVFYKYLIEVSPSVIGQHFMVDFHLSGAQVGNLTAFYYYAYFLLQLPLGVLLDRFGTRVVVTLSYTLCGIGAVILGAAHSLWLAECGRFISGMGAAAAVVGLFKVISVWFPSRRLAFMAGLGLTAGMLGAMIGQAPLAHAVMMFGWRQLLIMLGLVGIVLAMVYGSFNSSKGPFIELNAESEKSILSGLKHVLSCRQTWLLSVYSGLAFAPVMVFGGLWGKPFLQVADALTNIQAAHAVGDLFIGFAIGGPIFGWLSDITETRWWWVLGGTIFAIFCLSTVVYSSGLQALTLSVLLFCFGFGISSFLLSFIMVREINPLIYAATAIAFMNSFDAILGALSDPLIGKLLDVNNHKALQFNHPIFSLHDYHIAMTIMIVYLAASLVLLPFIKETFPGKKNFSGVELANA